MSESMPQNPLRALLEASRRLQRLVNLRAAMIPFQATLQTMGGCMHEPEARRQLLALWRPCQASLDLLLDAAPPGRSGTVRLRLMRQEMEDSLLDEAYSHAALVELAATLENACETLLLETGRDISGTAKPSDGNVLQAGTAP